jgi:siroheme synthase (precorrin-2 oxidase/ferrochelatase)
VLPESPPSILMSGGCNFTSSILEAFRAFLQADLGGMITVRTTVCTQIKQLVESVDSDRRSLERIVTRDFASHLYRGIWTASLADWSCWDGIWLESGPLKLLAYSKM